MVRGTDPVLLAALIQDFGQRALDFECQAHGVMDTSVLAGGLSGMVAKSMTTSLAKLTGEVGKATSFP